MTANNLRPLLRSGRLDIRTPTVPAAQSGSCAYRPGGRTSDPSGIRLLSPGPRGASRHRPGTQPSKFSAASNSFPAKYFVAFD